ncbi:hypothetical protein D3C72_1251340 [compost metagenome]
MPEAGAVVVVKGNSGPPGACHGESFQKALARGGRQDGQADAAHVDKIALAQGGENGLALGLRQPVAGGGVAAPVGERALAVGRGVDEIETGGLLSQALHPVGVDALLLPGGQHLAADLVLAEGRDVVHRERLAPQAGEIEGGVEGVAPETLCQKALPGSAQLHHAFADDGYLSGHGFDSLQSLQGVR